MSLLVIKEKLKAELGEIGDIQQIADFPTMDFQGYPAACVRTDEKTGQYETTSENYEEYFFTVFLLQIMAKQTEGGLFDNVKSREIIEALIDTVQDHFDVDEFMDGISMPSGRVLLGLRPTNYRIFEEESGKYVIGEIKIVARVSKTI